jgi:hypothetical protein
MSKGSKALKLSEFLNIDSNIVEDVEQNYMNGLKNIYSHYSKFGDKVNGVSLLNYTSWLKIFQDIGLVEKSHLSGLYINKQLIFKSLIKLRLRELSVHFT